MDAAAKKLIYKNMACGVTAEAHCYKVTRTAVFVRAHAWDADPEDPIATAQTVFVRSKPGKRP